jgi:hypothetical protein
MHAQGCLLFLCSFLFFYFLLQFFSCETQLQTLTLTYTSTHYALWTHAHTLYLYENLTELDQQISRLTPMNTRTHTLSPWAPLKNWVGLANLEINEVTTGALLSTGTSPTTERIVPLNPGINPGKCEHPCQVGDLNPGGQVLPQGTQPAVHVPLIVSFVWCINLIILKIYPLWSKIRWFVFC